MFVVDVILVLALTAPVVALAFLAVAGNAYKRGAR